MRPAPSAVALYSGGRFGNDRSDVVLSRSLVSGNVAQFGTEIDQREGGVVTSTGFNLFGHNGRIKEHALAGRGLILTGIDDIIATSNGTRPTALASILNPTLSNNGGLTQTHALVPGSPAIDGAGTCPAKDQRGVSRPQDGNNDGLPICDIGAFEREP